MWRFHDLKTAATSGVDPACMVDDAFGQHLATLSETLANGLEVAIPGTFDGHEEHNKLYRSDEEPKAGDHLFWYPAPFRASTRRNPLRRTGLKMLIRFILGRVAHYEWKASAGRRKYHRRQMKSAKVGHDRHPIEPAVWVSSPVDHPPVHADIEARCSRPRHVCDVPEMRPTVSL
jgi:hypothetical protein